MICPKRRWSKARSRSRRANYKIEAPALVKCPQCHNFKLAHAVCGSCGYYKGREVIKMSEE
ncbi:MAG: 50S ribosomal protein L32 [Clostridia bacterium]|nr:50S ribosomal protein L32 [Clostridia bacterium]